MDATEPLSKAWQHWFQTDAIGSLIGGELCPGTGDTITLIDPATEQTLTTYRDGGAAAAQAAVSTAEQGALEWQALSASQRGRILWAVAQNVRANAEQLAQLESLNAGKPIRAMAMLHPAYLLRQPAHKRLAWRDMMALAQALEEGA